MNPFIVIDGYQRVGKTTLGKSLEQELHALYFEKHGDDGHITEDLPVEERYKRFLELNHGVGRQAHNGKSLISNRYMFTTKAAHEFYAGLKHGGLQWVNGYPEVLPDLEIILHAKKETILRRFKETGKHMDAKNAWEFQDFVQHGVMRYVMEFKIPYVIIDTDACDRQETVKKALRAISMLRGV